MKIEKKLLLYLLCSCLLVDTSIISATTPSEATSCSKIKYVPRNPVTVVGKSEVTSAEQFSPKRLGRGWMTFDHIGYKDSAYQGERHVAIMEGEGVQFFGYDAEPLTDMMLINHPDGENQIINTIQTPVRADWHTLNGNGILFGCSFSGYVPNTDVNTNAGSSNVSVTGYSVVATLNKIEVRQYTGATIDTIGESYTVLYEEPKKCPGQNITVEITGSIAKVFLGSEKIHEFPISTTARGTGLITTYKAHGCSSLSSVLMMNHTVNGIDYLKTIEKEVK